MITLPLKPQPERTFEIEIGNITYQMKLYWNRRAGSDGQLAMDIVEDGGYTRNGISVVSGINFIERFSFSTIKNLYAVNVADYSQDLVFDQLGITSFIVILDDAEVSALEAQQDTTA